MRELEAWQCNRASTSEVKPVLQPRVVRGTRRISRRSWRDLPLALPEPEHEHEHEHEQQQQQQQFEHEISQ